MRDAFRFKYFILYFELLFVYLIAFIKESSDFMIKGLWFRARAKANRKEG